MRTLWSHQLPNLCCKITIGVAADIMQYSKLCIASNRMSVVPVRGAERSRMVLPCAENQYEPGSDEAFARQLQQQLDMEDDYPRHHHNRDNAAAPREAAASHSTPATHVAQDLAQSLFAFDRPQEVEGGRGRGRGRGGRRGGRGHGRR